MIYLIIKTKPTAKARPRFSTKSKTTYTPTKTVNFERLVSYEARRVMQFPTQEAVSIKIKFNFIKAKSNKKKYHTMKPDIDNLIKGVLDGLNKIAFRDDCQVIKMDIEKSYADQESVEIWIDEVI